MTDRNIFVYIETAGGEPVKVGLEMLTPAREAAGGGKVTAVIIDGQADHAAEEALRYGADNVIAAACDAAPPENTVGVLSLMAGKYGPDVIMIGSTPAGRETAPRLAARLGAGCITDVNALTVTDDGIVWTTPLFGGTILEKSGVKTDVQVVTIRSGAFKRSEVRDTAGGGITNEEITLQESGVKTKIIDSVVEISEQVNLEDAEIIVTGGKGMGTEEDFLKISELADVLGATVGATRPVIEAGWASRAHQVGQSGKIVSPKLYIAFGVSGATQHLTGMVGSDFIVAVNKDEDAPIFEVADIGIVGDAKKVLPIFIEECRKLKNE